jgi:hypothetical protein
MNTLVRKLHLYCGLLLMAFVVMYCFTGLLLDHEDFVARGKPTKSISEHVLTYGGPWTNDLLGTHLQRSLNLPGRLASSDSRNDGSFSFRFANAGVQVEAQIPATRDRVTLIRSEPTVVGKLHAMHRFHGYGGGWLYNLWAFALDLSSVALLVFAIAGAILWYQQKGHRTTGWALLTIGTAYSLGTIVFFFTAR